MGFREVKVYEGEFATFEQLMTGDPARPPFPEEVWQKQVQPGEFAVRYKDFKTGLARSVEGKPVQASEICRIFDNLEEAKANSRQITKEHWTVVCHVFDNAGAQVEVISNKKELGKYAAVAYAGILFWIAVPTLAVMGVLWLIYQAVHAVLFSSKELNGSLGWLGWMGFSTASFALAALAYFVRIRFMARRRVAKIRGGISPEDRARFEDINRLCGTSDPKEREKLLALQKELEEKVRQSLKK
jgi:hypothetical protein